MDHRRAPPGRSSSSPLPDDAAARILSELGELAGDVRDTRELVIHATGELARHGHRQDAIIAHLGLNESQIGAPPESSILKRMKKVERALRGRAAASSPDLAQFAPREVAIVGGAGAWQEGAPLPTRSWRPQTSGDWSRLIVAGVIALGAIAAAVSQALH